VIVVVATQAQVTEVAIQGATRIKESRLRKEITTKPDEPLSEATVEADRQKILEYYRSKGFTDTDVQTSVEATERLGTSRVVFTINEGGKTTISDVRFEGNTAISDRELRRAIK